MLDRLNVRDVCEEGIAGRASCGTERTGHWEAELVCAPYKHNQPCLTDGPAVPTWQPLQLRAASHYLTPPTSSRAHIGAVGGRANSGSIWICRSNRHFVLQDGWGNKGKYGWTALPLKYAHLPQAAHAHAYGGWTSPRSACWQDGSAAIIALTQAACVRRRGSFHVEGDKPICAGVGEGQRGRLGQADAD